MERGKWDIGVTGTPAWNYLRSGYYFVYGSAARRINPWLELGAYVFDRFYRDLHAARHRREFTAHGRGNLHTRV